MKESRSWIWNAFTRSREQTTIDVAHLEDTPERLDKPIIPHPPPHAFQKQSMMDRIEVTRQITFDDLTALRR